jgi:hypothetical protein
MRKKAAVLCLTFVCCVFTSGVRAVGVDIVFLGVLGNDAPAIEQAFDTRVREALSVNPEYRVLDYLASQDLRRRIGFDEFPTVSRHLVEGLRQFSSDSTIFVWMSVKSRTIKPVRRQLVKASAQGEIVLTLNMYSLRYKEYAFIGDVYSTFEKPEGFIFFYPLETGVHISATDCVEITDKLVSAAAFRAADLVTSVVRSEKARVVFGSDTGGMSKYKAASISDMFSVPSVEGANVERARKRTPPSFVPNPAPAPAPSSTPVSPVSNADQTAKSVASPAPAGKQAGAEKKASKADSAAAK